MNNKIHFFGFDIETKGEKKEFALQPYRLPRGECEITSFSCVDENNLVVDEGLWPTVEQLRNCLEKMADDPWAVVVGSNMIFDVAWMIALGLEDVVRRITWFDLQALRRGLENTTDKHGWGLKPTVAKFLPQYAGYEAEVGGNFDKVDEILLAYNHDDSWHSAQVARIVWDQLDPTCATLVQVISQCIPAFARAWIDGVPFSREALALWDQFCTSEMEAALQELEVHGLDGPIVRSPQKLLAKLQELRFPIANTSKTVLSLYADNPIIAAVRRYKRAAGSKSRYINNAIKCLDYIGRDTTHPQPRIWGTYTGRCTYGSKMDTPALNKLGEVVVNKKTGKVQKRQVQVGVALHQWPKKREGKIARSCIVAPPGYLLAEYDFSNQESRILADITQDRTLLEVFNEGKDFHSMMGCKPAKMPYEEFYAWYKTGDKQAESFRQMGKVANLSLAYRTGAETFQTMARTDYDVILSFEEAAMLCRLFKETYPRVPVFWNDAIALAKQKGYATTRGDRRVKLTDWDRSSHGYASEQTAINHPVQGTGADMKFLGIALSDAYAHPRGAIYLLDLHDALFYAIPDDDRAMETARGIQKILNTLPYADVFGWKPSVPMPVDASIGKSWGELRRLETITD